MSLSTPAWSETRDDLVIRDRLYYKKFSDVPFTGKLTGQFQGSFKNGKREGSWLRYWENGQLWRKGDYKNRLKESFKEIAKHGLISGQITGQKI